MTGGIWENRVLAVAVDSSQAVAALNQEGSDGWELAGLVADPRQPDRFLAFLKRPGERSIGGKGTGVDEVTQDEQVPSAGPTYRAVLTAINGDRSAVIVALVQSGPSLHLKDAKRMVAEMPAVLRSAVSQDEAIALQAQLLPLGAVVEVEQE